MPLLHPGGWNLDTCPVLLLHTYYFKPRRGYSTLTLIKALEAANTPQQIISALTHGFHAWFLKQQDSTFSASALTVGSLHGPDILLTMAFAEQFYSIGWMQLHHGHLSKYWEKAYVTYTKSTVPTQSIQWVTRLIRALWRYTHSLWSHQNQVVHGHSDKEVAEKLCKDLMNQVSLLYETYQHSPDFILPWHQYIFTSCSLSQHL